MSTLAGKTALVTGASRGIGRAIALRLGQDGARVAVHYGSNEAAAKETAATIEAAGGSAFTIRAELGVPGDAETLWTAFDEHADGVDIVVNNVADGGPRRGIAGTTPEDFDRAFAINTKAPFFILQHALPRLRDGGRVVTISTGITRRPANGAGLIDYTMSKSALDALTPALAKELGPRGITVNTVAPGLVDTDGAGWVLATPEQRRAAASRIALGRLGRPDDIASAVAFLVSDDGRWVTGQWLDTSGGILL